MFEVLLLRTAHLFNNNGTVQLLDGSCYRRDGTAGGGGVHAATLLVDSTFDFVRRLNGLNLNTADMAMYTAVVLCSPGISYSYSCTYIC